MLVKQTSAPIIRQSRLPKTLPTLKLLYIAETEPFLVDLGESQRLLVCLRPQSPIEDFLSLALALGDFGFQINASQVGLV